MKPVLIALGAALALGGCASYGYDSGGFNAYYDDAYGPFYDGYWGRDHNFWYSTGRGRPYVRDEGHHFGHAPGGGMHGVHGSRGMFHRH
jgi:hypothetical protein